MTKIKPTIEAVKQQFQEWRVKKQAGDIIQEHLWDAVGQLTVQHKPGTIIKHLKLSTKQMSSKGLYPSLNAPPKKSESSFVNIKLPAQLSNTPQLIIRRTDGTQLSYANLSV